MVCCQHISNDDPGLGTGCLRLEYQGEKQGNEQEGYSQDDRLSGYWNKSHQKTYSDQTFYL